MVLEISKIRALKLLNKQYATVFVDFGEQPFTIVAQCGTIQSQGGLTMSTKTTTIRFNEEEQKILDLYMEFQSQSLSTVLKEALFEDITDFFDSVTSEEAIEYNKTHNKRYSTDELMKELGID